MKKPTVLTVEDDVQLLSVLKRILKVEFISEEASTLLEARVVLHSLQPEVVLLDLALPSSSGGASLKGLSRRFPGQASRPLGSGQRDRDEPQDSGTRHEALLLDQEQSEGLGPRPFDLRRDPRVVRWRYRDLIHPGRGNGRAPRVASVFSPGGCGRLTRSTDARGLPFSRREAETPSLGVPEGGWAFEALPSGPLQRSPVAEGGGIPSRSRRGPRTHAVGPAQEVRGRSHPAFEV